MILVLGKAGSRRLPNLDCRAHESPGCFDVSPKNFARDVMYEQGHCCEEASNHQFSITAGFWIIQILSAEECSSLMQSLMQIHCSTCSDVWNGIATQYACSLSVIYCPQWLVQWSCHHLHMLIPVHSPWLPGYIDVVQTVLIILTMAGLFLDRPHILSFFLGKYLEAKRPVS